MTNLEQIARVFENFIESKRAIERKMFEEINVSYSDPFADTVITIEKDHVKVTFDGMGYDYLSFQAGVGHPLTGEWIRTGDRNQDRLIQQLKAIDAGLGIENINSWSFGVWV